ncbi:hypothetical protein P7C70_g2613, partial [Phenoliferia sp. Uapishka_3]
MSISDTRDGHPRSGCENTEFYTIDCFFHPPNPTNTYSGFFLQHEHVQLATLFKFSMRASFCAPIGLVRGLFLSVFLWSVAEAHMTIFTRSMYGVGGTRQGNSWTYAAGDPVSPLGPGWTTQDSWWFRGPAYRALAPPAGEVTELPAGGTIMLEITCHIAWTSFGWSTTVPGSALDACPYGTAGPYHSGDPNQYTIDPTLTAGCALGIANVDDISLATMDNIVIFSVQPNCVVQKNTTFDVPAMMPACTGAKCICAWFWLTETGTANMYMTGFDCNVTNVSPLATPIAKPQDAVFCDPADTTCTPTAGAKRPMYAYNTPTNIQYPFAPDMFNSHRPGYHASWSWTIAGAQTDIFEPAGFVAANITANLTSAVASASSASTQISSAASSTAITSSSSVSSSVAASNSAAVSSSSSANSIPVSSSSSAQSSSSVKMSTPTSSSTKSAASASSSLSAATSSHLSVATSSSAQASSSSARLSSSSAHLSSSSAPIPSSSGPPSSSSIAPSSIVSVTSLHSSSSSASHSSSAQSSSKASSSSVSASSSNIVVGNAMFVAAPAYTNSALSSSTLSSAHPSASSKASSSSVSASASSFATGNVVLVAAARRTNSSRASSKSSSARSTSRRSSKASSSSNTPSGLAISLMILILCFRCSMYGVGGTREGYDWHYIAGDPVSPLGPWWSTQDSWWFRGPASRAQAPPAGEVSILPAGGSIMLEITCHIAYTSFGWYTTVPGSALDACPYGTAGPYHSGDPSQYTIDPTLTAGCALGIANVDDISLATMNNIVIFSIQPNCVAQKNTIFDVPTMMPACTGSKCICAWFWLAETGTANFYMTGFDCNVSGVSPLATPIAKPRDAVFCIPGDTTCTLTAGAKRPMYAYK